MHIGGMLNHYTARTRHQGLGHVVDCVGLVDPTAAHAENSGVMPLPFYGSIDVQHDADLRHDGLKLSHVLPFVRAIPYELPPASSPDLSCCSVYESPHIGQIPLVVHRSSSLLELGNR